VLAPAVLLACGEDMGPRVPAAIVVTPQAPRILTGEALQLTAVLVDAAGGEVEGEPITFHSSDPTIVTVSGSGLVTSPGPLGTATITATSGDIAAEVEAVVVLPSSALVVRPASLVVNVGDVGALSVTVTDENGEPVPGAPFSIESTNPDVASAEVQQGDVYVFAHTLGAATLTVTSGERTAEVPVTVAQIPSSLSIQPANLVLAPGGSQQLSAVLLDVTRQPIDTSLSFTWSSSDESVITVSQDGLVTSVGPEGTATVTATTDSLTATLDVFVGTAPAGEILARTRLHLAQAVAVMPGGQYFLGGFFGGGIGYAGNPILAVDTLPDLTWDLGYILSAPPRDIVVADGGRRTYLVGGYDINGDEGVVAFDLDFARSDFIPIGRGSPLSGSLSDDGSILIVGTSHGLEMIDLASKSSLGGTGAGPVVKITHHPSLPLLYATVEGRSVLELDATSGEILRSFAGDFLSHAVTPDGAHLYTVSLSGGVGVLTLNTGVQQQGPKVSGTDLAVSPDGRFLYVIFGNDHIVGGSQLYIIDRASGVTVRTVTLGGLAERIVMSEDGTAIISNSSGYVDFVQ
jgi:uncharacterized protein YjdB